jgi:hypothetical protein
VFEFGPIDIGILLVFVVSLVWVGVDSHANKVPLLDSKQYSAVAPFMWVVACVLLWIVFFPAYLVKRAGTKKHRASMISREDALSADDRAILCPRCGHQLLLGTLVVGENECTQCHSRFLLRQ